MSEITDVQTEQEFHRQVIDNQDSPVVVYFWSESCPHCTRMNPHLESAAEQADAKFVKVSFQDNRKLLRQHSVLSTPTVVLFRDGEEASRHSGAMETEELLDWIKAQQ